jgi:hypothetical protein
MQRANLKDLTDTELSDLAADIRTEQDERYRAACDHADQTEKRQAKRHAFNPGHDFPDLCTTCWRREAADVHRL